MTLKSEAGFSIIILPHNIGAFPNKVKLKNIDLKIGDEVYTTPETKTWVHLPPSDVFIGIPAGHVNGKGITKIREGRYKVNRIEISFTMEIASFDDRYNEKQLFVYEVDVRGDDPFVFFRPEWIKNNA